LDLVLKAAAGKNRASDWKNGQTPGTGPSGTGLLHDLATMVEFEQDGAVIA
jgi:hypothetical protein